MRDQCRTCGSKWRTDEFIGWLEIPSVSEQSHEVHLAHKPMPLILKKMSSRTNRGRKLGGNELTRFTIETEVMVTYLYSLSESVELICVFVDRKGWCQQMIFTEASLWLIGISCVQLFDTVRCMTAYKNRLLLSTKFSLRSRTPWSNSREDWLTLLRPNPKQQPNKQINEW